MFRAYDIRGRANYAEELTGANMRAIGKATGQFMQKKGLKTAVVGRDLRISSPKLQKEVIHGLLDAGIEIVNSGATTSGMTMFAANKNGLDAGLYVTASHLPPEWNGFKMYYGDGQGFHETDIQAVKELAMKIDGNEIPKSGEVIEKDFSQEYIDFMKQNFNAAPLKIIVDCGGATSTLIVPQLFKELGHNYEVLFAEPDPKFSGRSSDPTEEAVSELKKKVVETNADFGVAFDGDADRCAIVDEKGRYVNHNKLGILLALKCLEEKPGGVVLATVECSMAVEKDIADKGKVIRIPVGHTWLTMGAKEHNAVFGMEDSGHYVLPKYYLFDDAMLVAMKLTEIISEAKSQGKKLSELVDDIKLYPTIKKVFMFTPETESKKFPTVERMKQRCLADYDKPRVNTMDGVRVDLDEGWVLIRASNTGPKIRVTVEAITDDKATRIMNEFYTKLEEEAGKI